MAARRKSTDTVAGCKRAGGTPVKFKKKKKIVCFGLSKKRKPAKKKRTTTKKRTTRKTTTRKTTRTCKSKQTPKQRAASLRNLKKARQALALRY